MTFPDDDTIDTYGGALVDAQPVEDPTTDRPANGMNAGLASAAAMTRTAPRAWVRFVTDGTTPTLAVSNNGNAAWGNDPGVRATPTRIGAGHFRLTWPATITDALGASHTINIRSAKVTVEGSTLCFAQPSGMSANVVDIFTWNAAGTANDIVGTTLRVDVW